MLRLTATVTPLVGGWTLGQYFSHPRLRAGRSQSVPALGDLRRRPGRNALPVRPARPAGRQPGLRFIGCRAHRRTEVGPFRIRRGRQLRLDQVVRQLQRRRLDQHGHQRLRFRQGQPANLHHPRSGDRHRPQLRLRQRRAGDDLHYSTLR